MILRSAHCFLIACLILLAGCGDPKKNPADAANAFLRAVHREDCKTAFALFSTASQERLRKESAKAIKDSPHYAEIFTPENLYCRSTYANRYLSFVRGSAKVESINGTNAIVMAHLREGTHELIPGFFPMWFTNIPVHMMMVFESGTWKLDLITPTPEVAKIMAARNAALTKEEELMAQYEKQLFEGLYSRCTNFHLVARWTFQNEPVDGKITDETGAFAAELLGANIIDSPEGKAVQVREIGEALRLPEEVLNYKPCGMITFRFRRDDAETHNRVLLKVHPGIFCETGIEVTTDGRIHYNVQRNSITSNQQLAPHTFYQLAFIWNQNGMRLYIDGKLDARSNKPAHIGNTSRLTELGRDPNDAQKTGSRMTIGDLRIYEGPADEATIADVFSSTP